MTNCNLDFYFIGANKVNTTWIWSDNSIFNYTHWYTSCDSNICSLNNAYIGYYNILRYEVCSIDSSHKITPEILLFLYDFSDGNWTTLSSSGQYDCSECCGCYYAGHICESDPF
jgi:hypothetical protein